MLVHEDLSREIIGAAMAVFNYPGPGLHEKHYERPLIIELESRGLRPETQQQFDVYYKSHYIGKLVPDLIVKRLIIVDTKVVECFHDVHVAQVLGYLSITKMDLGMLLNFKGPKLEWKRIVQSTDNRTQDARHTL